MTSAYTVYEFYLEPADLRGQTHTVVIAAASVRDIFNPRIKRNEEKIVLAFAGRHKKLPLNKTQTEAMIAATSTDIIERWIGATITLSPAIAPNKQATIQIAAPAAPAAVAGTAHADTGGEPEDDMSAAERAAEAQPADKF